MCMDKRNEFGETVIYFSQMKIYLRLSVEEEVQIMQLKPM